MLKLVLALSAVSCLTVPTAYAADAPSNAAAVASSAISDAAPASSTTEPAASAAIAEPPSAAEPVAPEVAAAAAPIAPAPTGQTGPAVSYVAVSGEPAFTQMKPSDAVPGALCGILCAVAVAVQEQSDGKKFVIDNSLVDPAPNIAKALAPIVAAAHGGYVTSPITDPKVKIDQMSTSARYVVVVETFFWGLTYYSFDWSHFHINYGARLRVIDTSTKTVIAKSLCNHKVVKADETTPLADLIADNATEIKRRTQLAADECLAKFKNALLGPPPTPAS